MSEDQSDASDRMLHTGNCTLLAGPKKGMVLWVGSDSYRIESSFSFPGNVIGYCRFPVCDEDGNHRWQPRIAASGARELIVTAEGSHYRFVRTLSLEGEGISVRDSLTSITGDDIGLIVSHRIRPSSAAREVLLAGSPHVPKEAAPYCAENPTLYLRLDHSSIGIVAVDTVSRLQWETENDRDLPGFSLRHIALPCRRTLTLRWTIYPFESNADYFTFINQVRRDWRADFTVHGPFGFFDILVHGEMLRDPARLSSYLRRKRLQIAALAPWLDYDNYNPRTGRRVARDEYRDLVRDAISRLKTAHPGVRCLGCIEGSIVSPPEDIQRRLYEAMPPGRRQAGYPLLCNDEQERILGETTHRWKDSILTSASGRHYHELYFRGPANDPFVGLLVYASSANAQREYWLEQARFLMEDVGLDGIYVDQFSLAHDPRQRYSYERWDGVTAHVDPRTGELLGSCTDVAMAGVEAQKDLIEYVLTRGGTMVANTHASAEEVQSFPIARFTESEGEFNPLEPGWRGRLPLQKRLAEGHLGSPISLGYRPQRLGEGGLVHYAEVIIRSVITYLRHGQLYYHYSTEIPEAGPGSGEYGPINHMFPLTPIGLHRGWIEGKERIVTAVPGEFAWPNPIPPRVLAFDERGREIPARCGISGTAGNLRITLELREGEEVAVIEESGDLSP